VFFIAPLISYPWYILSAGSICYLLSLPVGWKSYRDQGRKAFAQAMSPVGSSADAESPSAASLPEPEQDNRPSRLH
jgi:CDP-diacylglycerol--serine O-phosphatidyltransferase